MRVLVIGSGGREHALAWKLAQSPQVRELYAAPGNPSTAAIARNLNISPGDIKGLASAAQNHGIDITIVGPEAPLAEGIVDHFNGLGLKIVGPTRAAARLESSKVFAKDLMSKHGIPCAPGHILDDPREARRYISSVNPPIVVKVDGLAAGKGVTVARTREEAFEAVSDAMELKIFGSAGDRIIIEECLQGQEVSVFSFTDGATLTPLIAACDYKRALDNDRGPNTGGMGAYSPPGFLTPQLVECIQRDILEAVVRAMAAEGSPYKGILYGGLMLTEEGPRVLEFNVRLGDPEAQAVLPRLATDLLDICLGIVKGNLAGVNIQWKTQACVAVVMASEGYPGEYRKGFAITGLDNIEEDTLVFHAGTSLRNSTIVTSGGRVLTVVGTGDTLPQARQKAYHSVERIRFQGSHYRTDIAAVAALAQQKKQHA